MILLPLWMILASWPLASATIRVSGESPYCSLSAPLLHCVFAKTSQDVELAEMDEGVTEVKVESATRLHASPECLTTLDVRSSANVTLLGGSILNSTASSAIASGQGQERQGGNRSSRIVPGVFQGTAAAESPQPNPLLTTSGDGDSVSGSLDGEGRQEECSRNVSVSQSRLLWLRGQFERASLQLSDVGEVRGEMRLLDVKRTPVNKLDARVSEVSLVDSSVQLLTRLQVDKRLWMHKVKIHRVAEPGLIVEGSSDHRGSQNFTISAMHVNVIEEGSLRVSGGQLAISNMTVGMLGDGAIVVQDGGKLTLSNVRVLHGTYSCLLLGYNATLILDNFILVNKTIHHMELFTSDSQAVLLPLLVIAPQKNRTLPQQTFSGFSWYWLVVMAVVGQISGLVIGSAAMWRRPNLSKALPTITLSELLGRERLTEEAEGQTNEAIYRPNINRRDSGQTSSSFTSFTFCQERNRLSSISMKPPTDKPPSLEPEANTNIYVQVQPFNATQEDVIYEEVEAMKILRPESNYLPMH